MSWDSQVSEWLLHPVTKVFMQEVADDVTLLMESLLSTAPIVGEDGKTPRLQTAEDYMQLRGMIKALRGVLGMGVTDPLRNPEHKEG